MSINCLISFKLIMINTQFVQNTIETWDTENWYNLFTRSRFVSFQFIQKKLSNQLIDSSIRKSSYTQMYLNKLPFFRPHSSFSEHFLAFSNKPRWADEYFMDPFFICRRTHLNLEKGPFFASYFLQTFPGLVTKLPKASFRIAKFATTVPFRRVRQSAI